MTILFQHISAINFFVAKATVRGERVDCSRLLTNIFPYNDVTSIPNESSVELSTMEVNDKDEGVEGALVNSKAGPYQLDCISEALDDGPSRPYFWCHNIAGLKFPPPHTAVERTGNTPPGNMSIGESKKAAVCCILSWVRTYFVLNYIIRELERRPSQTLPLHPAFVMRE